MTLRSFLKDRSFALAAIVFGALAVSGMAHVLGIDAGACALLALTVLSTGLAALAWEYARIRRFYRQLAEFSDLSTNEESAWRLASLLDEPDFLEGRLAYEALHAASQAMDRHAFAQREAANDYREYVELWIHEIKTPIAAARLLAQSPRGISSSKLKAELVRIESLVEQALYYARSTAVRHDYTIRSVDLALVTRETVKQEAPFLIEKGVQPVFEIPDGTTVSADAKWLRFLLGQIIANAAKYGARTVRFSASTSHEGTSEERTVLAVADDGIGIPSQDVPRVFDKGFTGVNGRRFGSSTGMGLYLAAIMCDRMGLGLSIASEEGAGTRVLLTFPHMSTLKTIVGRTPSAYGPPLDRPATDEERV